MKIMILCFIFSFNIFAFNERKIIDSLLGIHGISWNFGNDYSKSEVKETLKKIIDQQIDLSIYNINDSAQTRIRDNAISEYGKFISQQEGHISKGDYQYLKDLKNDNSIDTLNYIELLKNSGSIESADILADMMLETQNLSNLKSIVSATKSLLSEHTPVNDKNLDYAYQKFYHPNRKLSFHKRGGDWNKVISKIKGNLKKINELVNQKSKSQSFKEYFKNKSLEITKSLKIKEEIKTSKNSLTKNKRKIASKTQVQKMKRKMKPEDSFNPTFLILGISLIIVLVLLKKFI